MITHENQTKTTFAEVRTLPRLTDHLLITYSNGVQQIVSVSKFISLVVSGKELAK